ncbi:MAG: RnfABCDGE type electron transport complex subunit D [Paludibacteraceae bacterium]|nr:RnfABCDGE type electron transport complex subunit D [Paludibacteraceae bacterium]MBP6284426.1 RnfABCDGE type electron transport complex subunit D [Paludibacteraceae bacterium]
MNKLIISPAPHIHSGDSISKNMYAVLIALIPAYLVGLYFFGIGALIVSVTAVLASVLFEFAIQKFVLKIKPSIQDGSAALTGLLLAFNLPSNLPIWIIIVGAFVAIAIGKMSFGGLGNNPFNPALVGRVFLLISFPVQMTSWPRPIPFNMNYLDAETAATPLAMMKYNFGQLPDKMDLLIGNIGGSIGEISAIALLLGGIYLLVKNVITWHIPVSILLSTFVFTGILYLVNPELYTSPDIHMISGGLLLGAIFMATDYATSPMNPLAQILYGIGIGIITVSIRLFGAYPEGVSFAILIMNGATPLLNLYAKPKRFGAKKIVA